MGWKAASGLEVSRCDVAKCGRQASIQTSSQIVHQCYLIHDTLSSQWLPIMTGHSSRRPLYELSDP